jgi:enoyl-CoA hydratase
MSRDSNRQNRGEIVATMDDATHVAELTFNRPEKLNAITGYMEERFFAELSRVSSNPLISCIIIKGNGSSFCAGYDINEHVGSTELPASAFEDWWSFKDLLERWSSLRNTPIPTVAAIQGHCFGIATVLGSMVDLVVIAENALWGAAQLRGGGGSNGPTLAALVGQRKAREIEYRAAQLTGREAVEIGWANYAVPSGEVVQCAREIAQDIGRTPREALVAKKAAFNRLMDHQGWTLFVQDAALTHTMLNYSQPVSDLKRNVARGGFADSLNRE